MISSHFRKYILCLSVFAVIDSYAQPKSILSEKLDSIIEDAIEQEAFPGAQVYVSIANKIIHHKSYGFHTYSRDQKVDDEDVYDLASITKVSTCLPVLMQMVSEKKIDIDRSLGNVYPVLRKSNKKNLTLRSLLAHQAGLIPYIVFWSETLDDHAQFKKKTFARSFSQDYPIKVAERLFLHESYWEEMFRTIEKTEINKNPAYRYSGLFFQLLPSLLEPYIGQEFESYLYEHVYVPLNIDLTFHPRERYQLKDIVPTERDDYLRMQLVHGFVHDEAAAMWNGISCNAGLFGNAINLGKLFEAYLMMGKMGGVGITPEVINEFTAYQYPEKNNRRGLAFDKPLLKYNAEDAYIAESASPNSFGHSGFTGTFVWADPDFDMVFVLLSNRVYPTRENRKLYSMNIRPQLHQAVYDYLAAKRN